MANKFYITTAIDYVNAKPHIGHAYEKTLADAIARWNRLQNKEVFFLTGVDENAQKNVQAAEKAEIPTKEFIDKNANFFIELCQKLNISYDDFIRTTSKQHAEVVQKIVKKLIEKEDIYKGKYTGLYCIGCETYYTEKDLVDGKCLEHKVEPEKRTEEAYLFKLSKYENQLLKIIPQYVIPKGKAKEVMTRIKEEGLNDICISRKGAKWGIDFPNDKDYKIWVWIDALINYISGLKENEKKFWPADLHVIGKGINWFHSVIWPSLLISANYQLPKKLLVHGYLNLSGQKVSKSLGNVIDPIDLLNKYGTDSVRYSFLRCSVFDDTEYSEELLIKRHNTELANKLGNLVSRVSALAETYGLEKTKVLDSKQLINKAEKHFDNLELDKALSEIFTFIDHINEYIQEKKPWETKDKKVLYQLANAIKDIAILLSPFMPETCKKISNVFNFDLSLKTLKKPLKISKIKKSNILFKKIETEDNDEKNKENSGNYDANSSKFSNGQSSRTKFLNASRIKSRILDVLKTSNTINRIAHKEKINKSSKIEGIMSVINFKDWEKIELRVGKIEKVEDIEGADKLYNLTINIGNEKRTICAGLKKYYEKDELEGKMCVVFVNLAPRMMKGIESQGMLLAAVSDDESKVVLLSPEKNIKEGSRIR